MIHVPVETGIFGYKFNFKVLEGALMSCFATSN